MATISGRIGNKSKWFFPSLTILILVGSWLCDISLAQSQSFKRICKNGIIFYYFSSRGESGSRQAYFSLGENKIIRLPLDRKVPPRELEPVVEEASRHYNLPPTLIKAVIRVESNFVHTATSPKGARGLMQLMPGTAEALQVRNPYDIKENIWAGTRYLSILLDKFGYRLPLALAAYNAGPQRVEQYQDIPPIKETQGFVRDVCVNFLNYSGKP
ncbi:MAG: lytic transglycosylase domain-containing protein [Thermodesulfobacteriota bacterium]